MYIVKSSSIKRRTRITERIHSGEGSKKSTTFSSPSISGVSLSTVSFSSTTMSKGCKKLPHTKKTQKEGMHLETTDERARERERASKRSHHALKGQLTHTTTTRVRDDSNVATSVNYGAASSSSQYAILNITRINGTLKNIFSSFKDEHLKRAQTSRPAPYLPKGQAPRFAMVGWIKTWSPRYPHFDKMDHSGRVHQISSARKVTHPSTKIRP